MSEKHKKDSWDKFQIWINCFAVMAVGFFGFIVNSTLKSREVNVKYVEMAIEILRAKPDESQTHLRDWAISIVNRYSAIQLSPEAQAELKTNSLPGRVIPMDDDGKIPVDDAGRIPITN